MTGDNILQLVGSLITAALVYLGVRVSTKPTAERNRTDAAQGLLDQLQEERDRSEELRARDNAAHEAKLQAAHDEIDQLRENQRQAYRREVIRDDFIQELRNHIRLEKGPPPPPWPEELRNA